MSDEEKICEECGYVDNSFPCRIRHLQVNTAQLKREREGDSSTNFGLTEQR